MHTACMSMLYEHAQVHQQEHIQTQQKPPDMLVLCIKNVPQIYLFFLAKLLTLSRWFLLLRGSQT